jgi:copper(I)-binding protein
MPYLLPVQLPSSQPRNHRRDLLCGLLACVAAGGMRAIGAAAPITVLQPWCRATPPGTAVGVAYFEIANAGAADELLSIISPVCKRVEMHATTHAGGMMHMEQQVSVPIPEHARVIFGPSGLHAMLLDLTSPLRTGDRVPLTLNFRHAGSLPVVATVRGADEQPG